MFANMSPSIAGLSTGRHRNSAVAPAAGVGGRMEWRAMRAELRRSLFLACVGLLAGFALVVTLYGAGTLFKRGRVQTGSMRPRRARACRHPPPSRRTSGDRSAGLPRPRRPGRPGRESPGAPGSGPGTVPAAVAQPAEQRSADLRHHPDRAEWRSRDRRAGRAQHHRRAAARQRADCPCARRPLRPVRHRPAGPAPGNSEITLRMHRSGRAGARSRRTAPRSWSRRIATPSPSSP